MPDLHDAKQISNHCHQIESVMAEAAYLVSDLSVCILRGPPMASVWDVVKRRLGACMAVVQSA